MDHNDVSALVSVALSPVSTKLVEQFADWYSLSKEQRDAGIQGDYWKNLDKITRPTMFVAGAADKLVPVKNVKEVYDQIQTEDKKLLVCSKDNGFAGDYGHMTYFSHAALAMKFIQRLRHGLKATLTEPVRCSGKCLPNA